MSRFSAIPKATLPRSSFKMDYTYKTTIPAAGKLIPFYVEEILPGDSVSLDVNLFARLTSPLAVPIMDNMFIDTQFFFVPNRLVWDHWKEFMGENTKTKGIQETDYIVPHLKETVGEGDLADYLAIPTKVETDRSILAERAISLIWNEWYRDENLQDPLPVYTGDQGLIWELDDNNNEQTVNGLTRKDLLPRNKRHDYFTSSLPWPQKGPSAYISIAGTAPVVGNGLALGLHALNGQDSVNSLYAQNTNYGNLVLGYNIDSPVGVTEDPEKSGLVADMSSVTSITINNLRESFALQHLMEAYARGGSRYTEIIRSCFNVISSDARLQRPEYLGGFSEPMMINTVASTAATSDNPQANLSAFGLATASEDGFTKSFEEHGYIIGFASIRASLTYQQGLARKWSRRTRHQYYFPQLAHLGEMAVLNKEIYADGTDADEEVFGYQERWSEYRYHNNEITGKFRSNATGTLDNWHLSQYFTTRPQLNSEFIVENPPIDRVVAVTDEPPFLLDVFIKQNIARVMPLYSVPGLDRL